MQPITLGTVEIPNRVVRSAHFTNLGNGVINDDTIAYHLQRAEGGVGLTIVEVLSVHRTSPGSNNIWLLANQDGYRKLVDTIAPTGMKLFQQLWHAGNVLVPEDGGAPWSASDIANPVTGVVPIAMTKGMIDEIVQAYADAALQCERWGIEGVELHASHSYLPAQFLSPAQNFREDEYGGSFENRARFTLEVLEALRTAVGRRIAVGMRIGDDASGGGLNADDYLRLVRMAEARDLLDFVHVSMGGYHHTRKIVGGMHEPAGYQLATSTPITRAISSPTIVIGRFRTLEEADQVIRDGDADMVAMTRAHIADPHLVRKTIAGHPEQVRPCIGCNQGCLAGINNQVPRMGCVVNPAVGFEQVMGDHLLTKTNSPRTVFVIGGGPAGLEAARVAATRGHRVILAEAQADLGGTLNIAARAPTRHGIRDIAVWLEEEVYRLGVDVRLGTYADASDVLAEGADTVIVATGSSPRMDGIQVSNPGEPVRGIDHPKVVSSHDVFTNDRRDLGKDAVIIDDVGHYEAIAVAEHLIELGLSVTLVTRHPGLAPMMDPAWMNEPALTRLQGKPFTVIPRNRALAVDDDGVVVGPTYLPRGVNDPTRLRADTVVFVSHNRSNREVLSGLAATGLPVRIVGDAHTPRFLGAAIREGSRAGAEV
jgi:2,4-dienoyl-CoA reductase-like NADH-dependent reductase (Old Yellow Enzyme family)/NAD(P)-dependent dehydrogenase (short-subunit alcohol dehydrogenase family)